MPKKSKHSPLELIVLFDTNAVFTGSASYLFRREVADAIRDNQAHVDLSIRWILPAVVKGEREYQMRTQARAFLPQIEKLERLLGHKLGITEDVLDLRVSEAVASQIAQLKLSVEELDVAQVAWTRLIADATSRRPPFDAGEKEKGFRDAIVLETVAQVCARAPQSPKTCRIALLTSDGRLTEAASTRFADATNFRVLASVDELRGYINTLASTVDEAFVKQLSVKAKALFFAPKDEATLYYTEGVRAPIAGRASTDAGALPGGADGIDITGYTISSPQFVKKEGQRVHWSSRIEVGISAYKLSKKPEDSPGIHISGSSIQPITPSQGLLSYVDAWKQSPAQFSLADYGSFISNTSKQTVVTGRLAYEVPWSAVVTTAHKLTRPVVGDAQFVDVAWS